MNDMTENTKIHEEFVMTEDYGMHIRPVTYHFMTQDFFQPEQTHG
jgi:uncharacterized protein (UPF0210 family)